MNPEDVVQAEVDAFNARDLERFLSCYSSDAVVEDGSGAVIARGLDGIRDYYAPGFAHSPDLHVEVPLRIHFGSRVIDQERVVGTSEGQSTEIHGAAIYQIRYGKIVRARLRV